jgi:TetR/AcrR family transcriptional repressor of bet genes
MTDEIINKIERHRKYLATDRKDLTLNFSLAKIAHSLTAMMDGFWVEYLIADGRYTPEDAVKACFAFLASFFPEFRKNQ